MQDNFEIPNYNDSIMLQKQIVKGHGDTGEGGHGHAEKNEAEGDAPYAVATCREHEAGDVERQCVEQVRVANPDHHDGADAHCHRQQRCAPVRTHRHESPHHPVQQPAAEHPNEAPSTLKKIFSKAVIAR